MSPVWSSNLGISRLAALGMTEGLAFWFVVSPEAPSEESSLQAVKVDDRAKRQRNKVFFFIRMNLVYK